MKNRNNFNFPFRKTNYEIHEKYMLKMIMYGNS